MTEHQSGGRSFYHKIRLYTFVGIGLLAVIMIFQNTANVETQLLLWKIEMPRAALLAATLLAGFVGGVVWTGFRRRR
ncbi:MAG: hypothetical protein MK110_07725 [Fuerstiella sp.]|nr:hypothetical protein [Fuerstiella sp.]